MPTIYLRESMYIYLVHMRSDREKKYFMAIKDESSGYIHVEFIGSKTQTNTLRVLDNFLKLMKSRVPRYGVGCIRTDNGTEFHNKLWDDYLSEGMISCEEVAPYQPQSNGFAESIRYSNSNFVLNVCSCPIPLTTPFCMITL